MIGIFLRGLLMGAADAIPGISGGTIALITGIYERLIAAVKAWSDIIIRRKIEWKRLDIPFLLFLGAGIGLAIFTMAHLIGDLLAVYFVPTISFFIGLILASALYITRRLEGRKGWFVGLIGLLVGVGLAFVTPGRTAEPSLPYLFLSGMVGIMAMFLPGISGAFILVVLGTYEFLLGAVRGLAFLPLGVFSLGALIGAVVISRIIAALFARDRQRTLFGLLGLVVGALAVPVRDVLAAGPLGSMTLIVSAVLLMVGVVLVLLVERWAHAA